MSHITCPLCGKNAPLSTFDPEHLELDIFAVSFKGLGRAGGFKVADRHSILGDDDVTPKVLNRMIELCRLFVKRGIIDSISLSDRIGLTDDVIASSGFNKLSEENVVLRKQLSAHKAQLQDERTISQNLVKQFRREKADLSSTLESQAEELEEKESELANIEDQLQGIIDSIEEYTDYLYDSSDENRIDFIEETVGKLLEDHEALKADKEE